MSDLSGGVTFAPTADAARRAKMGGVAASPRGDAVQVLNFQLKPRVAGVPGGLSPLQSQTTVGGFGNAVVQSVLKTVLGADALAGLRMQAPPYLAPNDQGTTDAPGVVGNPFARLTVPGRDPGGSIFGAPSTPAPTVAPTVRIGQTVGTDRPAPTPDLGNAHLAALSQLPQGLGLGMGSPFSAESSYQPEPDTRGGYGY